MLGAYPTGRDSASSPAGDDARRDIEALKGRTWIDLVDPTDLERAAFEIAFGLRVPTREEISEIETTSRLQTEHGALYMTAPLIFAIENEPWLLAPTGFVLSKDVLMTLRFARSTAFDTVVKDCGADAKLTPAAAYVRLLEELVGRAADLLEGTVHDLDEASHVIFRQDNARRLARETEMLRRLMIRTGRTSERMARLHYSLVCLDRMAKFTIDRARDWLTAELVARLQSISSDIASLVQFTEGLVNRVQLLQDAATGIINIDQNDVMKVLTVASVVGIPPVLVAGIYGMNFKDMPEYNWSWGYPYALALIAVTAVVPLIWFKLKDWI
jgi:magnesium transporter